MAITVQVRVRYRLQAGKLLRALARKNISQNDFARRCGISSGYMSQLLSGERHAGPRTRQKIMDVLPTADFDSLFEEVRQ